MKVGDIIFWHGRNTIALVIRIESYNDYIDTHENLWVCLLDEDGVTYDDLSDGYTIVDENWGWPVWHNDHKENTCKSAI